MKIAIIGAGWYGCHTALELKKAGHDVVIYEKNPEIFSGISGEFGIRLHKGPHYPRSQATRDSCLSAFNEFCEIYPDLIQPHELSIYALGTTDANGNPPKVDKQTFTDVCHESPECQNIDIESQGLSNLQTAMTLDEPSIVLGDKLRDAFKRKLADAGIPVHCNYEVSDLERINGQTVVTGKDQAQHSFDYVVNATSYQALIPESFKDDFPVEMEVVYQPCLALKYKDKMPGDKPISFIVMDGWFPCLMPVITNEKEFINYILTHGSYTIMGSYPDPETAKKILAQITEEFIATQIKPNAEHEMHRFWPGFSERFEFQGWKGTVLAKLKTKTEFRSSLTFEHDGVVHIFPGKVSNVFHASKETIALINNEECVQKGEFRYARHGVLDDAIQEIEQKPEPGEANTCSLNTFETLTKSFGLFREPKAERSQNGITPPAP